MHREVIYAVCCMALFGTGVFFYKLGNPGFSSGLGSSVYIASHMLVLGGFALFEKTEYAASGLKYLVLGGVLSGLGQLFFFQALRSGKLHVVVPIRSLSLIVTVLLGLFVLSERLSLAQGIRSCVRCCGHSAVDAMMRIEPM